MKPFESVGTFIREGLVPALIQAAQLLDLHGLEKHGVQGWRDLSLEELRSKAIRHLNQAGTDDEDSGLDHAVHAFVRVAQVLVLAQERRCKS